MNDKVITNAVDYGLIGIGTLFGLTDIESILGIIILVIQFIWVVLKIIFAIKNKNKEELKTAIDEGTELIESIKDKQEHGNKK